jgi:hypothetical protein
MDVSMSTDEGRCEVLQVVGRFLLSDCTADLSEDREISDSEDDGISSFNKVLARPKQVVDLTTTMILPR